MSARERLFKNIVGEGLCVGCGLCVAACPEGSLAMSSADDRCLPLRTEKPCSDCLKCLTLCPGGGIDYPAFMKPAAPGGKLNLLGDFNSIEALYATDEKIHANGASGGAVTALLKWMLKSGRVESVIAMDFSRQRPYLTEYRLISDSKDADEMAGSKYAVNHLADALKMISGPTAVVTLPCQTQGIRKWQRYLKGLSDVKYVLGLYCGNNLYFDATSKMMKKLGAPPSSGPRSVAYRAGKWPGNFRVEDSAGRRRQVNKDGFNIMSFFCTPVRCHMCSDLTNDFADISFGDCWQFEGSGGAGHTLVISRTEDGRKLIEDCRKAGAVAGSKIEERAALTMHSHLLKRKKYGVFARIKARSESGHKVPSYKLSRNAGRLEVLKEKVFMSRSFSTLAEIFFIIMPIPVTAFIMRALRLGWKKHTRRKIDALWEVEKANEN